MRSRVVSVVVLAAVCSALLVLEAVGGGSAGARPKVVRLKAFGSCKSLVAYANRYAGRVGRPTPATPPAPAGPGPQGAAPGTPAAGGGASPDYSRTNVQEEGVDEPDIVKSNGATIFAVARG